jgi:hypothetical protein
LVTLHRLTVNGRDYFLPDPVTQLKGEILRAIQAGGGYVTIPPLRGGPGLEILFSPGMPVLWAEIDVSGGNDDADHQPQHAGAYEDPSGFDPLM